jgi:DNA polymerase
LNARGIPAGSIGKGETEELLVRADLFSDPLARKVIELRSASAKSSVAKYHAMLRAVCRDGRSRGTLNFHGARTGRWAGRLWQPQNLPRIRDAAPLVEELHEILSHNDADTAFALCRLNFEDPLDVLSKALRSMVIAAPGHVLIGGDYANIEGRVNAWLAGEHWKTAGFYAFDAGEGPDLYKVTYARAYGIPVETVTKEQRNGEGKTMDLAFGFGGGVRAYHKAAAERGMSASDAHAEGVKQPWREAHPAIKQSWYTLQDAALAAVRHPGMKVPCLDGKITYLVARNILWCRLPSGRPLAYCAPFVESGMCKACEGKGAIVHQGEKIVMEDCTECWATGQIKARVAFYGMNSTTKQWWKNSLWGGLQCENVVQGIARDILAEGMFRLEAAGYPLVLTVHDENICEVPEGFGSPEELAELMSIVPDWAEGLPVAVSAWRDTRYVK